MSGDERRRHKNVGNKNAVKLGMYSKKLWSRRGEVRELAVLFWERRCVGRRWQMDILASPVVNDLANDGGRSWEDLRDGLIKSSRENFEVTMLKSFSESMSQLCLEIATRMLKLAKVEECRELRGSLDAVVVMMRDNFMPLVDKVYFEAANDDYRTRPYGLAGIERVQKLQAQIDGRIAKVMQRLVALKEAKRMGTLQQIAAPGKR